MPNIFRVIGDLISSGITGSQSASGNLTVSSTTNATKGKILFGTSAYDEVNDRLGIGTASPTYDIDLTKTTAANGSVVFAAKNTTANGETIFSSVNDQNESTSFGTYGSSWGVTSLRRKGIIGTQAINGLTIAVFNGSATAHLSFLTSLPSVERLRLFGNTGNVLIQSGGTFTDAGFRLDVNGTARVQTSLQTPIVESPINTSLLLQPAGGGGQSVVIRAMPSASTLLSIGVTSGTIDGTSGNTNIVSAGSVFNPTSGTRTYVTYNSAPTINQTGGANGITRGVYVNPTLTAAADWRSIETSNNTGFAAYFAGTAPVFFNNDAHIQLGTGNGTKIGTGTTQKLAFWNATPIAQPTTSVAAATLVGGGGATLTDTDTFDGYTLQQVVKALRNAGLLA